MNYTNAYIENLPVPTAFISGWNPFRGGIQWYDPPQEWVDETNQINAQSPATVNAVRNAKTNAELITAIQARADFIKARTDTLVQRIKDRTGQNVTSEVSGLATALSVVPLPGFSQVGQFIRNIANQQEIGATQDWVNRLKAILTEYSKDAQQLAEIYKTALSSSQNNQNQTDSPILIPGNNNAPMPINWLWVGAGVVVLALIFYALSRKRK